MAVAWTGLTWRKAPVVSSNAQVPLLKTPNLMLVGLACPIWLAPNSVNHMGPAAVARRGRSCPGARGGGWGAEVGMRKSAVMLPVVVTRPMWLAVNSVNHRAPSGPVVMKRGLAAAVGTANSVMAPAVVMRPI